MATKKYELIVEQHQPTCGGKPPKTFDFIEMETEDPKEYVKAHEKGMNVTVDNSKPGTVIVEVEDKVNWKRYIFTEI